MNLDLEGKLALVSGASRGIGRAIALGLAAEGARVCAVARGEEGLALVAGELDAAGPGPHATVAADVATEEGADNAVSQAIEALGGLDIVVANVGKSGARHCSDMDDADFGRSLDVNLWSTMRVCQRSIPALEKRGGGVITMISSIWGREAGGSPGYNVAKAGVTSLAKAMATDYAAANIRVNSVAPGSILFPGGGWERKQKQDPERIAAFVERELPFGRFGTPEEVADVVLFLSSARSRWISGASIVVDGCQSRSF